ncbi:hypothetical protein SOVF_103250 [Spinacia oleracea]|nr:hypothetical protein SOVF_103250 [Spinacia oleracea]
MCKGCLLSFASTDNNNNNNNNKSECSSLELLFDDEMKARVRLQPQWMDDTANGGGGGGGGKLMYCSCCGEAMKVKYHNNNITSNSGILSRVPSRLSQAQTQAQAPAPSPRSPFGTWRADDVRTTLELSHIRCQELKSSETTIRGEEDACNVVIPTAGKEETKLTTTTTTTTDFDDFMEEFGSSKSFGRNSSFGGNTSFGRNTSFGTSTSFGRNPSFGRNTSFGRGISSSSSNRFLGINTDSTAASPRLTNRVPRKSLLEKVELGSDPVETIIGNETDIEVIMTRLKNQIRLDRKSLVALYMELDEERSASAVAANNAMAMITRLQAEKASVQMEALQYQRMMEEQAEYDKEDIQMLKDFLNKKEDEIRDLEAELDLYRDRCGFPDVNRADALEKSLSYSSISEHGSPLFSIGGSFYEEGENSGRKTDDYEVGDESSHEEDDEEEGENIDGERDQHLYDDDDNNRS